MRPLEDVGPTEAVAAEGAGDLPDAQRHEGGDDDEDDRVQLQGAAREPDAACPSARPGKRKSSRMPASSSGPVALDAVPGPLDAHHRRRRLAAQELGDVVVVDDGPGQAAHEQERDGEPRDGLPPVGEVGRAPRRARCGSGRSARPSCRPRAGRRCAGCRGAATTPTGSGCAPWCGPAARRSCRSWPAR